MMAYAMTNCKKLLQLNTTARCDRMKPRNSMLVLLCLTVVIASTVTARADTTRPYSHLANPVTHSMTIRIVLVGIKDVDHGQLIWNLEPSIKPAILQPNNPNALQSMEFGTSFYVKYDIVSASQTAASTLESYLKSATTTLTVPDSLQTYGAWSSQRDSGSYAVINATQAEDWLSGHISEFGGIPDDGYTLIVADMSSISSMHHYYQVYYNEQDAASSRAPQYSKVWPLVDWTYSWGGHYRFYYLDLSAGDPKYDHSGVGHVPIQDFTTRYYSSDTVTYKRSVQSVTEYVADYVTEAVRDLFLPSYVYAPTFAASYKIVINIFDDTGKLSDANIGDYVSTSMVKKAFQELVPYAMWDVSLALHRLSDDPGLETVVSNSVLFTRELTGTYDQAKVHTDYYDYRPVYLYLQNHLAQYVSNASATVVLPEFEFVFKSGGRFFYSWEESIGDQARQRELEDRGTFTGLALGDLVVIGTNERYLYTYGDGLSHTSIHEVGHNMGLMHPHSYGYTEDYVSSPMSYLTHEVRFSQFDIDAIQRAHADYFFSNIQQAISVSSSVTFQSKDAQSNLAQAETSYQKAMNSYATKDYASAVSNLQGLSKLVDQAFDAEAVAIQDKVQHTSATSDVAKQFLNDTNNEILAAKQQKTNGNLGLAYQLLAEASKSANNALQAEAQAQAAAKAVAQAQQSSTMLVIGVGIAVGLAVGIGVSFVILRRKRTQVTLPTLKRFCINCGTELSLDSKFCNKCGSAQP